MTIAAHWCAIRRGRCCVRGSCRRPISPFRLQEQLDDRDQDVGTADWEGKAQHVGAEPPMVVFCACRAGSMTPPGISDPSCRNCAKRYPAGRPASGRAGTARRTGAGIGGRRARCSARPAAGHTARARRRGWSGRAGPSRRRWLPACPPPAARTHPGRPGPRSAAGCRPWTPRRPACGSADRGSSSQVVTVIPPAAVERLARFPQPVPAASGRGWYCSGVTTSPSSRSRRSLTTTSRWSDRTSVISSAERQSFRPLPPQVRSG